MWYIMLCLIWGLSINGTDLMTHYREVAPMHLAYNQPTTFGKTHFIIGEPLHEPIELPAPVRSKTVKNSTRVFFAPDDDIRTEIQTLIQNEKKGIKAAIFLFTDPEIAQILAKAKKRGVQVELITDTSCLRERHNKIATLCDAGCSIYVYNPSYKKNNASSLMHHKFALFEQNKNDKPLVWTGSFNFTKAASALNQENAIVFDDRDAISKFEKQFNRLKERSYRYGNNNKRYAKNEY